MSRLPMLGLAATLLLAAGCDLFDDDAAFEPVPFESLSEVSCLRVLAPGSEVFTTKDAWEAFWADHVNCFDGYSGAPFPAPSVDFATEMLIGVHWGVGYSGCSSAVRAIRTIGVRDARLEVYVGPLPDLGSCLAQVEPIEVVRCGRSEQPVVFFGAPGQ